MELCLDVSLYMLFVILYALLEIEYLKNPF